MKCKRKRLYVNPKIQGTILTHVFLYWLMAVAVIALMVAIQMIIETGTANYAVVMNRTLTHFSPAFIAGLVVLPVILFDCLRLTNRVAGQLLRLREEMRSLATGEPVGEFRYRSQDLSSALACEFNRLIEAVQPNDDIVRRDDTTDARDESEVIATTVLAPQQRVESNGQPVTVA